MRICGREMGTHCFTGDNSCQKKVSHLRGMKEWGYCLMTTWHWLGKMMVSVRKKLVQE